MMFGDGYNISYLGMFLMMLIPVAVIVGIVYLVSKAVKKS